MNKGLTFLTTRVRTSIPPVTNLGVGGIGSRNLSRAPCFYLEGTSNNPAYTSLDHIGLIKTSTIYSLIIFELEEGLDVAGAPTQ